MEEIILRLKLALGPTIFGAMVASISMIILRKHDWREALSATATSLLLALAFAPVLADFAVSQWGLGHENALSGAAAVVALVGRDGVASIAKAALKRVSK